MVPFEPDAPPDVTGRYVLISAGQFDATIPPAGSERLAVTLRAPARLPGNPGECPQLYY